ncbi:MAG: hypothetical protein KGD73_12650 [Candidatus Lokiarchaeota archaeon]|nr:hypothetical protein [Candidatus Lokiarchaeota archaeon]
MEIQWGKMILHGLLNAVFYIGLPLGLIYIFEYLNVITFAESFTISIMIFGIIGTIVSMLKHAFPKETSANRLMAFFISLYSGIYLFYIFGGFEAGTKLGTYYINTEFIQILLGLQVIAWLLLGSTIIRALQYLVEAIELRKKTEYRVTKKGFKLSQIFKAFGFLMGLVIMGYFASIIYSGMNLNFNMHDIGPGDVIWDQAGTPGVYTDDAINMTLTFDITNNGIYAIYDVNLSLGLYLSNGTKLGGAPNRYYSAFHSFTQTLDQSLTIVVNSTYVGYLILNSDTLTLQISFETIYAAIYLDLDLFLPVPWTAIV